MDDLHLAVFCNNNQLSRPSGFVSLTINHLKSRLFQLEGDFRRHLDFLQQQLSPGYEEALPDYGTYFTFYNKN
jgi:hypothetical protein